MAEENKSTAPVKVSTNAVKKNEGKLPFGKRVAKWFREMRSEMRKAGVEYVVLKNHIVNRAAQANGVDESFHNYLKGPSAFAFGYDDAVAPARILKDTVKKLKKCEIKGGIINGVVTDAAGMNTLADLPSREQLIARLLGSMMSPISKLAIVLGQIQEQKGGSDAAPAEAAE